VLIARSRVENHTATVRSALGDLNDNIQRLRSQMRDLAIQAEAQIQARSEKLAQDSVSFDPLEFDRFTRLQELTRMIAESIEDVATIQSSMLKGLQTSESDLSAQYRLTRELQQQLMRVRLVPFASVAERIYRVARQSAKELGKRVNVDIRGGRTELDRVVLERMAGPLEHMVRNAIVHGLESPQARRAAGKSDTGELRLEVRQEGNEIVIVVADDGAGLDLARIRARALSSGVLRADQQPSDRELMELIFAPGFSTATEVTELAGRGVGMDVVRSEMLAFGGRIAISSEAGRGTRFTLNLPLTLAVTQVVLASVGGRRYAIPAGMVEQVGRVRPEEVAEAISDGVIDMPSAGQVALRTMAQLLGEDMTLREGRQVPVVLLRSGDDRMAIVADEVSANQEVVVKNVGAQVSRLAGILGATILGNGEIVLIVNPVQLIVRAPEPPQLSHRTSAMPNAEAGSPERPDHEAAVTLAAAPLVMVVDDSLTVRRVTQRLLERSGYEVLLAKDGVDAVRQLQDVRPDLMLVDIEMPRMDGFDLTRHVRGTELTRSIPIIMITSRTADKHRRMAMELGVNAYLGKPYQDDELMALIRSYLQERVVV
jgi:chemosensory pili system protein ChpA (sensor histidine kinase/response regulator)